MTNSMKCWALVSAISGAAPLFLVATAHGQGQTNVGELTSIGYQQGVMWHNQLQGQDVTMENSGTLNGYGDQSSGILVTVDPSYDPSAPPLGSITVNNTGAIYMGVDPVGLAGEDNFTLQHGIFVGGTPWDDGVVRTGGDVSVTNTGVIMTRKSESRAINVVRAYLPGTVLVDNSQGSISTFTELLGGNTNDGIYVEGGMADVTVRTGGIVTHGPGHAAAVVSDGTINITSDADSHLYTWSKSAMGIMAQSAGGPISVAVNGILGTMGVDAHGISQAGLSPASGMSLAVSTSGKVDVLGKGAVGAVLSGSGKAALSIDGKVTAWGEYGVGLLAKAALGTTVRIGAGGNVMGGWQTDTASSHQGDLPAQAAGLMLGGSNVVVENAGKIGAASDRAIRDFYFPGDTPGPLSISNSGTITGYVTLQRAPSANSFTNTGAFISRHFAATNGFRTVDSDGDGFIDPDYDDPRDTDGDGLPDLFSDKDRDARRVAVNDLGGSGSTFLNSGAFSLGASDGAAMFDSLGYVRPQAGVANVALDGGFYDFARDGLLQSQFLNTASFANSGSIDLRGSAVGNSLLITSSADAATVGSGTYVANGGTIYLNTVLNAGLAGDGATGSQSDVLIADRVALGAAPSQLDVSNVGGPGAKTGGNGIVLVQVRDSTNSAPGAFVLKGDYVHDGAPAQVAGAYAYKLYQGGLAADANDGDWYLRSTLRDGLVPDPLYQSGSPIYESYPRHLLGLIEMPTLQQRVGNRVWGGNADANRSRQGDDVVTAPTLAQAGWLRLDGLLANIRPTQSTTNATANASQSQLELGGDGIVLADENGAWIAGLNARYGQRFSSITSPHGDGAIATTFAGLGVSVTWYDKGGFYLDNQARITWAWSELQSATAGQTLASGNASWGFGLSSEIGQRIALGDEERWTLTPQAQLSYGTAGFGGFTDAFGVAVTPGRGQNLTLRLGLSLDYEDFWIDHAGRDVRGHGYAIANLKVKLTPQTSVEVGGTTLSQTASWLNGELGVGGSINLDGDKVSLYGEALIGSGLNNFGNDLYGQGKIGLRVAF